MPRAATPPYRESMIEVRRRPSFEDLYRQIVALPENQVGEILEPGVLRTMSRPGQAHRHASRMLVQALNPAEGRIGGGPWWLEVEAEVKLLGDRLVVPDIAGWRDVEASTLATNPITTVPDWCCEILSPSTGADDRTLKLPLYAQAGVGHVWLLDPTLRTLEVYATRDGTASLLTAARAADRVHPAPLDVEVDLARLWLESA